MCYLIKGVKKYRDIKATVKQGREPTSGHTHVLVNSQTKEKQHVTNMGPSVIKKEYSKTSWTHPWSFFHGSPTQATPVLRVVQSCIAFWMKERDSKFPCTLTVPILKELYKPTGLKSHSLCLYGSPTHRRAVGHRHCPGHTTPPQV